MQPYSDLLLTVVTELPGYKNVFATVVELLQYAMEKHILDQ